MDNSSLGAFAHLAPELRNHIWVLALSKDEPHSIDAYDDFEPGITRTSQQTRKETTNMFYAANDFAASIYWADARRLCRWLKTLGSERRAAIKFLRIEVVDCCLDKIWGNLFDLECLAPSWGVKKWGACFASIRPDLSLYDADFTSGFCEHRLMRWFHGPKINEAKSKVCSSQTVIGRKVNEGVVGDNDMEGWVLFRKAEEGEHYGNGCGPDHCGCRWVQEL